MIEIIGNDKNVAKEVNFNCKCEGCGCIFTATLDDADLIVDHKSVYKDEYRLRIKCPKCSNSLFYEVKGV